MSRIKGTIQDIFHDISQLSGSERQTKIEEVKSKYKNPDDFAAVCEHSVKAAFLQKQRKEGGTSITATEVHRIATDIESFDQFVGGKVCKYPISFVAKLSEGVYSIANPDRKIQGAQDLNKGEKPLTSPASILLGTSSQARYRAAGETILDVASYIGGGASVAAGMISSVLGRNRGSPSATALADGSGSPPSKPSSPSVLSGGLLGDQREFFEELVATKSPKQVAAAGASAFRETAAGVAATRESLERLRGGGAASSAGKAGGAASSAASPDGSSLPDGGADLIATIRGKIGELKADIGKVQAGIPASPPPAPPPSSAANTLARSASPKKGQER